MRPLLIVPGDRFGLWTVLYVAPTGEYVGVLCDCGTESEVRKGNLANARSTSCGCVGRAKLGAFAKSTLTTHGMTDTPEYRSWDHMKQRCLNPANHAYVDYGGRGIKICARWLGPDGFENFLDDMGSRPSPKHSIDRIDVNGNYEPSNSRWATAKVQRINRRSPSEIRAHRAAQNINHAQLFRMGG